MRRAQVLWSLCFSVHVTTRDLSDLLDSDSAHMHQQLLCVESQEQQCLLVVGLSSVCQLMAEGLP